MPGPIRIKGTLSSGKLKPLLFLKKNFSDDSSILPLFIILFNIPVHSPSHNVVLGILVMENINFILFSEASGDEAIEYGLGNNFGKFSNNLGIGGQQVLNINIKSKNVIFFSKIVAVYNSDPSALQSFSSFIFSFSSFV